MTARRFRRRRRRPPEHARRVRARLLAAAWRGAIAAARRSAIAAARRSAIVAALAALLSALAATADPPVRADNETRFVSLRAEVANLRVGPGRRYPIDWVYKRRGLPLLVVAQFDQWRWVQDHEGTKGWMHQSLLSTHRTALIVDGVQTIRKRPLPEAPAVLRAEAGVVADLLRCEDGWCRIALAGDEGWVPATALWGIASPAP